MNSETSITYEPMIHWDLQDPSGKQHRFLNLKQFIRDNPSLFEPADVAWHGRAGVFWCRAYCNLARLRPGNRVVISSWKGWSWCGAGNKNVTPPSAPRFRTAAPGAFRALSPVPLPEGNLWSAREVASILKVPISTMYYLVKMRRLPAIRIGGRWRFSREEILRLLSPPSPPSGQISLETMATHLKNLDNEISRLRAVLPGASVAPLS